jgi:hypothetical protein
MDAESSRFEPLEAMLGGKERRMLSKHLMMCGAAGAALLSWGCSEPVPPAAEGATTVHWLTSNPSCRARDPFDAAIGAATSMELLDLRKDTVEGMKIFCRVADNGGSLNAEGSLELRDITLDFAINNLGSAASEANPALGHVSFSSIQTAGGLYASPAEAPCKFFYAGNQIGASAAGKLWIQFTCEQLVDASTSPASVCGTQGGTNASTLAVQNCDQ